MANQYTARELPDKGELQEAYENGLTQTELATIYGVSQKVIWSWFKKLAIKARIPKKRNQEGSENDSWKGNKAGVAALHYRLKKVRGKANKCEVCKRGKYFEWANLTGKYNDIWDYKMMCKSCHAKYDKKYKNFAVH